MSLESTTIDLMVIKSKNNSFEDYCYGRSCSNCKIGEYRAEKRRLSIDYSGCDTIWDEIISKQNNAIKYK